MTNHKIQQVYVSNDEDNLTGVITETNIIHLITEISSDIGEEEKVAGDQ
jgi:predicted transcriptional regulator